MPIGWGSNPPIPLMRRPNQPDWGSSFVTAPDGSIVVQAPIDQEGVLVAEVDLGAIDTARAGWPFLRDRRVDAYEGLTERFLD